LLKGEMNLLKTRHWRIQVWPDQFWKNYGVHPDGILLMTFIQYALLIRISSRSFFGSVFDGLGWGGCAELCAVGATDGCGDAGQAVRACDGV
jgi:hypothetical protein